MDRARDRRIRRLAPRLLLGAAALLAILALRAHVFVEADVVYGVADGQRLRLDVYHTLTLHPRRPAVVLIHGGAWFGGSKADLEPVARRLAREGFVCFSVDYRLIDGHGNHYPAQLDDVQRAVRWARKHAAAYGIDPGRVGAFGHSAGAQLASLLGLRETRDDGDPSLARLSSRADCVVDVCGPADFTDPKAPPLTGPNFVYLLFSWLGRTREQAPDLYREVSPALNVGPTAAPFLILHGTRDEYVPLEQSRRFYEALRRSGAEATLVELEDSGHALFLDRDAARCLSESAAFLHRHLDRRRSPPLRPSVPSPTLRARTGSPPARGARACAPSP